MGDSELKGRGVHKETINNLNRVLTTAHVAVKGERAMLNPATGNFVVASEDPSLIHVGHFADNLTGDGTKTITVNLPKECVVHAWVNDENDPFADADFWATAFVVDGRTVSKESDGGTRPIAGRFFGMRGSFALVEALDVDGASLASDGAFTRSAIPLSLQGAYEVDGTALAAFADGADPTPGLALVNSKAAGIRWNNHATPDPVCLSIMMPADLAAGTDLTLELYASKTGATLADATKFTVGAFFVTLAALHDADVDCGGDSTAMVGNATAKTVQKVTLAIDGDDVPAGPCMLVLTIQPKDGTLGTDDVTLLGARITR